MQYAKTLFIIINIVRISIRLKGSLNKTVIRSAIMYGSECLAVDRKIEQRMSEAEMRMLR